MILHKSRRYYVTACLVLSLLALMSNSYVEAANDNIAGMWIVTVTVKTPPGAPAFVFTDLIAFNSGGTLTTVSSTFNAHTSENALLPTTALQVDTSDGYGAWRSQGDDSGQFALTFSRFLFAGANTSSAYGPFILGQYIGINTVEAVGTLQTSESGDSLVGSFTNQFVNLNGQIVFAGSGTFSATRFKIKPLVAQ
jgi:hypothetical protein